MFGGYWASHVICILRQTNLRDAASESIIHRCVCMLGDGKLNLIIWKICCSKFQEPSPNREGCPARKKHPEASLKRIAAKVSEIPPRVPRSFPQKLPRSLLFNVSSQMPLLRCLSHMSRPDPSPGSSHVHLLSRSTLNVFSFSSPEEMAPI